MIQFYDIRREEMRELTKKDWDDARATSMARFCQLIECERLLLAHGISLPDGRASPHGSEISAETIAESKGRLVEIGGAL